jgi:hypothetical protein
MVDAGIIIAVKGGDPVPPLTLIIAVAALMVAIVAGIAAVAAYELATQGPDLEITTSATNQMDNLIVVPMQYLAHHFATGTEDRWTVTELAGADVRADREHSVQRVQPKSQLEP